MGDKITYRNPYQDSFHHGVLLATVQVVPHIEDRLLDVNLKGRVSVRIAIQQGVLIEAHASQRTDVRFGHLVEFAFR